MELVELPVLEPTANEAVVKLAASGVNFIDVYNREGRYKVPLPFTPGQEGAGEVVSVGKDVKLAKTGDRVAWTSVMGAYAEYAAVAADRLVPIPSGVSDQQAAATMLQGMTAHFLSHSTYPVRPGDTFSATISVSKKTVLIRIKDVTTGKLFTKKLRMNRPDLGSAEWVTEAPSGCDNAGLLDHLRGSGPHVRGCWAVDLILSKDR